MSKIKKISIKKRTKRNDSLFDLWSIVHVLSSFVLSLLFGPFWALLIVIIWEPVEIFVLSPIFDRFGILFGHETLKNSLSDIIFDIIGVLAAYIILYL